ncbi:universal stress protein [Halorussus limi]|uniref:Universal stress protein n=1 Tax=Halorussus limi TaxID=2938695 RepID=A0A8U0HUS6_9EURY|nr:universal stress protein [Halorussus limi]UPV74404.1 universal stress protein [Halorussus limi]
MTDESYDQSLLSDVLLPVADEDDAERSARALEPYGPERVTVLHVVEKGEGVPDKTPVEQSEEIAAAAFEATRRTFPDADDRTAYRRDVVEAILDVADDIDASAVAFRPRDSGRLARFLSGNRTTRIVTEADRPVVVLPKGEDG